MTNHKSEEFKRETVRLVLEGGRTQAHQAKPNYYLSWLFMNYDELDTGEKALAYAKIIPLVYFAEGTNAKWAGKIHKKLFNEDLDFKYIHMSFLEKEAVQMNLQSFISNNREYFSKEQLENIVRKLEFKFNIELDILGHKGKVRPGSEDEYIKDW